MLNILKIESLGARIIAINLIGLIFLGTGFLRFGESLLNKTPVLRSIYKGLKLIFETVFLSHPEYLT